MNSSILQISRRAPQTPTVRVPAAYGHRTLDKVAWLCLWGVLIPQAFPIFSSILSTFRILPICGALGMLVAITLPRKGPAKWFTYWPMPFLAMATVTNLLYLGFGNAWPDTINYLYLIDSGIS